MRRYKGYLFDLDGVIYRGAQLLPGVRETLNTISAEAGLAFLTNASAYHREYVVERLRGHGLPASLANVYSSGYVAARRLAQRDVRTLYVIGEDGLYREFREQGLEPREEPPVDGVIVGRDIDFTFQKLVLAQQAILSGAAFYATNQDATYPLEEGRLEPGSGALVAALSTCTGQEPEVFGKPSPEIVQLALSDMEVDAADAILVGDRLDTDILCAHNAGVASALVLTGVTSRDTLSSSPPELQPTYVLDGVAELLS